MRSVFNSFFRAFVTKYWNVAVAKQIFKNSRKRNKNFLTMLPLQPMNIWWLQELITHDSSMLSKSMSRKSKQSIT